MWWNFVGRSHEEIVEFRREWQREQITSGGAVVADSRRVARPLRNRPGRPPPADPGATLPNGR